jgi:hypothetical protein
MVSAIRERARSMAFFGHAAIVVGNVLQICEHCVVRA